MSYPSSGVYDYEITILVCQIVAYCETRLAATDYSSIEILRGRARVPFMGHVTTDSRHGNTFTLNTSETVPVEGNPTSAG